jgi:hypothetical protein
VSRLVGSEMCIRDSYNPNEHVAWRRFFSKFGTV